MLGGEKEGVGAKRGMCGIFAGCGPVTDGAEQGTSVAVCWLVTRCQAIESGTCCVTSYAQLPAVLSDQGAMMQRAEMQQKLAVSMRIVGLICTATRARGSETVDQSEDGKTGRN